MPGSLQDKPGPSVATEFGILFPDTIGNSGFGASLAGIVSQRTSVAPADAAKRVNDTFAQAIAVAKDTTDKARRTGILTGLVTAMSLLISLAAAWWAAQRGGYHRDNAIPAAFPIGKRTRAAA